MLRKTDNFLQTLFDAIDAVDFISTDFPSLTHSIKLEDDIIEMEIPGVDNEKVSVLAEGNTLIISGEDRHGRKFKKGKTYPKEFNLEDVKASLKNGLLKIEVPISKDNKIIKKIIDITR